MNKPYVPKVALPTGAKDLKYVNLANSLRRSILAGAMPMGSKLPTEQELLETTGLSLTTVRRAMQALVDEGLIERKRGAGSFVSQWRSRAERQRTAIGVLVPDTHQYFHHMIRGVQDHLTSVGAGAALLATYEWQLDQEEVALQRLLESGAEGLILTPHMPHDDYGREVLDKLSKLPVPVILAERSAGWAGDGARLEHVISDHAGGAWDAIAHLHSLGHRRIGVVARMGANTSIGVIDGHASACAEFGIEPWRRELPRKIDHAAMAEVVEEVLAEKLTALLVFGDVEAGRFELLLNARGIRIPEDIAMVSYDDETAELAAVPLTAVSPAKYQLGQIAATNLLDRIRNGDITPLQRVSLRPVLVVRESCGARAGGVRKR